MIRSFLKRVGHKLYLHAFFWIGYATAFWGAFELAYQSGSHPIWSGTWGYPVPHHYIMGFTLVLISYIFFTGDDYVLYSRYVAIYTDKRYQEIKWFLTQ